MAYRLQLPEGMGIHSVFHVSLPQKAIGPTELVNQDLPPTMEDQPIRTPSNTEEKGDLSQFNAPDTSTSPMDSPPPRPHILGILARPIHAVFAGCSTFVTS